jgi:hypothetical protein
MSRTCPWEHVMIRRFDWNGIDLDTRTDASGNQRARKLDHLLKVAANTNRDAGKVWAELWSELKTLVGHNGVILPEARDGFVPECGWPEFFEKLWLLKHYLDSTHRICTERQ